MAAGGPHVVKLNADPVAAVRAASGATMKAGTAEVDTVVTMTTPAIPASGKSPAAPARTTTMHGAGLFDFGREIGRIDLTMANGALQEVLTPSALYLRSESAANPAASAGKGWSKVDISRLSDGNLVSGGSTDPAVTFAMLGGVLQDVKYIGQDKVRDTQVAHYQGTLDLADAASVAVPTGDANAAADKKALSNAARTFTTTKVPFDAYLDDSGRLRRFVARFEFTVPGPAHAKATVTSATELYSFGVPVGVIAPQTPTTPTAPATPTPGSNRPANK
jgi:hypothetical protein